MPGGLRRAGRSATRPDGTRRTVQTRSESIRVVTRVAFSTLSLNLAFLGTRLRAGMAAPSGLDARVPSRPAALASRCPTALPVGVPRWVSCGLPAETVPRARRAVSAGASLKRSERMHGASMLSASAVASCDDAGRSPWCSDRASLAGAVRRGSACGFPAGWAGDSRRPSSRGGSVWVRSGKRPGASSSGGKGQGKGKASSSGGGAAPKAAVVARVKLSLTAGKATPAPPVGPALGSKGVNLGKFCSEYNAMTRDATGVVPVVVTIRDDRSFSLELKTPPTSALLKVAAGVRKGATKPGSELVGRVTESQVSEIAVKKMPDLNCTTHEAAVRMVKGTARGMGIEIIPDDWTEEAVQEENEQEESEEEDWSDEDGAGGFAYRELGTRGEGWDDSWTTR